MKNETIAAIVVGFLMVVVGIQAYNLSRMNDRLDQLIEQNKKSASVRDDAIFKDRPWNPFEEMRHMQDELEHLFNESMSRFQKNTPLGSLNKTPDADLQEMPDRYVVTVNAPGADESSVDVKLDDRRLSIAIKTEQAKDESDDKNGSYLYRERFVGEFHRVLTLPGPADASKLKTDYRNGVLTITMPKK